MSGDKMKFRDIILYDHLLDKAPLENFIIKNISGYYIIIEFTDADLFTIWDAYKTVIKTEVYERYYNSWHVVGDDNYFYRIGSDCIERIDKKSSFHLWEQRLYWFKSIRQVKKHSDLLKKYLRKSNETHITEKLSFGKFKRYEFISKENGMICSFRLKIGKANSPLMIFFHGGGDLGLDNIKPYFSFKTHGIWKKIKNYDCSILIPQAPFPNPSGSSKPYNYIDTIKQLSEFVVKEFSADANRIYITGVSFGGICVWNSITKYPGYYACAVPVMGCFVDYENYDFTLIKNTPIWIAHSSDDKTVNIAPDDECYKRLIDVSADVKYSRWDKYGHGMSTHFYKNEPWTEWMFKQTLNFNS